MVSKVRESEVWQYTHLKDGKLESRAVTASGSP
jgi:hypothetical protein